MKLSFSIILLFFLVQNELFNHNLTDNKKIIAAYYPSYNKVFYTHQEIDFKSITHLCHAFIKPDSSGNLIFDDNFLYPELNEAAHKNGVQVLVSIGGWGNHVGFGPMAGDSSSRKNFIKNLTEFCLKNNYDGADIDWEYPRKVDRENFITLLKELKESFDLAEIKYLTAAIPSNDFRDVFNAAEMNKYLDWIGIMTYDFHGSWSNHSGHNSPLYSSPLDTCGSIDYAVNYYLNKGISREKLLIGIPLYGRVFNSSALYLKNDGGSSVLHQNSVARITKEGWKYVWDNVCEAPILYSSDNTQLISFEDVNSIKLKSRYVYNHKLGGTIVWALGQDFDGTSTPLLESLNKNLLNAPVDKPSAPIIASNLENDNTITLKWYPSQNAWEYEIEISTDSLFSEIILKEKSIQATYNSIDKLKDEEYFWRVRANNYLGYSEWSRTGFINPKKEN